jgi:hypothetical protein
MGIKDVFTSKNRHEEHEGHEENKEIDRNYSLPGKGGNAGKSVCFYPILEYWHHPVIFLSV